MNNDAKENNNSNDTKNINSESSFLRRLKYGSVAMVFTVSFVAVMVMITIVTTWYSANKKPLMIDMTKDQIFSLSNESRELLKDIKEPIEIVFFQKTDIYEKSYYGKMIVNCAKTFASEYENIKIREVDIIKNPGMKSEFTTSGISQTPQTTSIAIKSKGKAKLFSASAFFITAQSTGQFWAFCGEKTITQGILQAVSLDEPLVYYTDGHGESMPQEFADIFIGNGFRLEKINLNTADQETINEARIIVVCNPQKDFIGASDFVERSEIDKLSSYLNQFGSVMYFSKYDVGPLTNLDQLLSEYGIAFDHGGVVIDENKSLNNTGLFLEAEYYEAKNVGDELTASIRKLPSPPKTIVPYAKPIKILDTANPNDVSPVLTSSATSYRGNIYDNTVSAQGPSNLLVVAQRTYYENNNPKTALFLVCGSTQFLTYLQNTSYSNSDILLNAMRIMTSKKMAVDIEFKLFDSNALTMTIEEQNTWTMITILLLPTLVSIMGVVVWLRRRHS